VAWDIAAEPIDKTRLSQNITHIRQGSVMEKRGTIDNLDNLVRRVTVVHGSGENCRTEVIYESGSSDEGEQPPSMQGLERSLRQLLKAQVVAAQEAYQRHLNSVEKGGMSWMTEAPRNMIGATFKAAGEVRKSMPFSLPGFGRTEDDEDHGD
jgi:hypothetical protein